MYCYFLLSLKTNHFSIIVYMKYLVFMFRFGIMGVSLWIYEI